MTPDYSSWPRAKLIAELLRLTVQNVALTEGMHRESKNWTRFMTKAYRFEKHMRRFLHG